MVTGGGGGGGEGESTNMSQFVFSSPDELIQRLEALF